MRPSLLLLVLSLFSGCAAVSYSPYVGEQPECPTSPGAFVKVVKGVPIYRGYPSKPYIVLGHLTITGDPGSIETQTVWAAQKYEADAVLFIDKTVANAGAVHTGTTTATLIGNSVVATGSGVSIPVQSATLTGILIQFKDRASIPQSPATPLVQKTPVKWK
jgi:hypothetical protein